MNNSCHDLKKALKRDYLKNQGEESTADPDLLELAESDNILNIILAKFNSKKGLTSGGSSFFVQQIHV